MTRSALLALALLAAPAAAHEGPHPHLAEGETLEVELRGDFNADLVPDLAYVTVKDDLRELRLVVGYANETDAGALAAQVLPLDAYPLADASLTLTGRPTGKVLLLSNLTGGTTAVASTHRFRWDPKLGAMRLIGLDATLYSRTFAHDGQEASWNLLTGDLITRTLKLNRGAGDEAYAKVSEKRRKKPSRPVRLENAPSGDDLLGWPAGQ